MSDAADWIPLSAAEEPVALDTADCCRASSSSEHSPIDLYYGYSRLVVLLGTRELLTQHPGLDRLLLLGLVAGVEAYFRNVLAGVIAVCPLSHQRAQEQHLPFGAISYYGSHLAAMGLFENVSFSTERVIEQWTEKITGIRCADGSSLTAAISTFRQVCHLRHAAVHHAGELTSGNARALGLEPRGRYSVALQFPNIQVVAKACLSMVRAYNRFMFQRLVARWIDCDVLRGTWVDDKVRFSGLYRVFHSVEDAVGPRVAYQAYRRLIPRISSAKLARSTET